MEQKLTKLRNKRGTLKGVITRVQSFVQDAISLAAASIDMLEARRDRLAAAYKEYEELNIEIITLDATDKEEVEEVENQYFQTIAKLNQVLRRYAEQEKYNIVNSKLPNIDIPTFDGRCRRRQFFRDWRARRAASLRLPISAVHQ
ncbi:hypothetical protein K1T71_014998 [Dendrolimus kikuchii]|nr:hypothetical protein K1T71_014998 [Dendrolimus kikuchii]